MRCYSCHDEVVYPPITRHGKSFHSLACLEQFLREAPPSKVRELIRERQLHPLDHETRRQAEVR